MNKSTDIQSTEFWLTSLEGRNPANAHRVCLMNAVRTATKDELSHLKLAYPHLVEAFEQWKKQKYYGDG